MRRAALLLAAAPLALAVACGRETGAPPAGQAETVGVTVQPARVETLRESLQARGVVVPAAGSDWTVFAPEAARIVELPKTEGDAVAVGDLLVRFDIGGAAALLDARRVELAEAEARVSQAAGDADRLASLFDRGLVPRLDLEAARRTLATAEATRAQIRAEVRAAEALASRTVVLARFPGVVLRRYRQEGDFVEASPDNPVLRVADPSVTQIAVQLSLADLARTVPGQRALLHPPAGDPVPAVVAARATPSGPDAASAEIRLTPDGPTGLVVDDLVEIEILLDERAGALTVPAAAIQRDAAGTAYVMVPEADRARRRDVRVGLVTRTRAEIIFGLAAGDAVIVGGLDRVTDGTHIAIER